MKPAIRIAQYLLLVLVTAAFLVPVAWTLISAIKPEGDIVTYPPRWIPERVTLANFQQVLQRFAFLKWMWNSLIVTSIATTVVVIIDSLAAYALARLKFWGKEILFVLIISMLLIPIQAYVIPLFLIFSGIKLLDTRIAVILPLTALVTGVYLFRQFFEGLPMELEEAARIDGWNDFQIYWYIMMPLAKPILSSVAILSFIVGWNEFLWPLIVTNSDKSKTLPVGLSQFMGASGGGAGTAPTYGLSLSSACMAIVPTVVVFLIFQKYFVQGISTTGLKR
jgi:ABC-type glycerol-3-phosphate transport system permease component